MPSRTTKPRRRSPLAVRLGASIRDARIEKAISQEQLAELASLSKNYIGNIERGEYDVTVSVLHRVASALNFSASDLMKGAGL
jgi:transcriptional regulator with XRE-family HTH domain